MDAGDVRLIEELIANAERRIVADVDARIGNVRGDVSTLADSVAPLLVMHTEDAPHVAGEGDEIIDVLVPDELEGEGEPGPGEIDPDGGDVVLGEDGELLQETEAVTTLTPAEALDNI